MKSLLSDSCDCNPCQPCVGPGVAEWKQLAVASACEAEKCSPKYYLNDALCALCPNSEHVVNWGTSSECEVTCCTEGWEPNDAYMTLYMQSYWTIVDVLEASPRAEQKSNKEAGGNIKWITMP